MIRYIFKGSNGHIKAFMLKTKGSIVDLAAEISMLLNSIYNELLSKDPCKAQAYKDLIEHGVAEDLTWRKNGINRDEN